MQVRDSGGGALAASIDLVSEINQLHRSGATDAAGQYAAQDLPFGLYKVRVSREGFQAATQVVRVGSEVPVQLTVALGIAAVRTSMEVSDSATLIDPTRSEAS